MMFTKLISNWLSNAARSKKTWSQFEQSLDLITFYYGLDGLHGGPTLKDDGQIDQNKEHQEYEAPTLVSAGNLLNVTPERARQLISSRVNVFIEQYRTTHEKNSFIELKNFLIENDCCDTDKLNREALSRGWISGFVVWPLVFKLIKELDSNFDFEIVDTYLKPVSMSKWSKLPHGLIVRSSTKDISSSTFRKLSDIIKKFSTISSRSGITKFSTLVPTDDPIFPLAAWVLQHRKDAWYAFVDGELWISSTEKENTLVNIAQRVLGWCMPIETNRLAEVLAKSLRGRAAVVNGIHFQYPDKDVIKIFLETNSIFRTETPVSAVEGSGIIYVTQKTHERPFLTTAEYDLLTAFNHALHENEAALTFSELYSRLIEKGHKNHTIKKTIVFSPFTFPDKSMGRRHYKYQPTAIALIPDNVADYIHSELTRDIAAL